MRAFLFDFELGEANFLLQEGCEVVTQQRKLEDYMRTIYLLRRKGPVRGADIAIELEVTRPTVSISLKALEQEGYLTRNQDRSVELTPQGLAVAYEVTDRHQRLFELLVSLGVHPETAREDAGNMEHAISMESLSALVELATCRDSCKKFTG